MLLCSMFKDTRIDAKKMIVAKNVYKYIIFMRKIVVSNLSNFL